MVKTKEDLTGRKFGMLTVINQAEDYINPNNGDHIAQWNCKCDCGNDAVVRGSSLKNKNGTRSCGCLQRKATSKAKKKYNTYDLDSYNYGIGYTSKGEEFWFDKEDYDLIKDYCWYYDDSGYVVNKSENGYVSLHRLVMGITDENIQVDHKKHSPKPEHKFDNRKENLRIATNQTNQMNSVVSKNNTSGITGVSWDKSRMKWSSYIFINGTKIHLGYYENKEDAIKARKEAEIKYFGEYRYSANN